jgi:hypothetical protein
MAILCYQQNNFLLAAVQRGLSCALHGPPFRYLQESVYTVIFHLYVTLITPISLTELDWILRLITGIRKIHLTPRGRHI